MLREIAEELGAGETFRPTDVGVHFDEEDPERVTPDPYFGGVGPSRNGCRHCARCTSGCPHNAKNTLPKNYPHLAERAGATVHELTEVVDVRPRPGGGYTVRTRRPGRRRRADGGTFEADQVVLAASALGTQRLLHRLRRNGSLPAVSARVGERSRSNSEAIVVATARAPRDLARGVAITSSFHPDPHTHVELVHASESQDSMSGMNVPLVDGGPRRVLRFVAQSLRDPGTFRRVRRRDQQAQRTVSLLVMQSLDNSLTSYLRRGRLRTRHGSGPCNPSWIPLAHDLVRRYAAKIDGDPVSLVGDVLGKPATAHFIGGAVIGETADTGVVDPYHRLHGYDGLHVVDGSTIGANLGVNPALTITAMAERALALWPNKGEVDPRPPRGSAYRPVRPVAPRTPAVPEAAPGALRLPLLPTDG